MRTTTIRSLVVAFVLFALAVVTRSQGLYWESKSSNEALKKEGTQKSFYMPKMFRQDEDSMGISVIVRLDKKLFITINWAAKEYSQMTFDEMEAMVKKAGSQVDEQMKQMKEQMAKMPEEQRKMVEKMMNGKMMDMMKEGKIDVKSDVEKKTIGGYSCSEYLITKDGKDFATLWVTKDIPGYTDMRNDMKEFGARMASMIPRNGSAFSEGMRKIDGFPIEMQMPGIMTTTVTKVEKKSTPLSEFEIPAGFTKKNFPMGQDKEE